MAYGLYSFIILDIFIFKFIAFSIVATLLKLGKLILIVSVNLLNSLNSLYYVEKLFVGLL